MKYIILLFNFIIVFNTIGQNLKLEKEKFTFQKVDTVSSLSKKEIYERSKKWIVRNLKSSDSNIELNDSSYTQLTASGTLLLNNIPHGLCILKNINLNFKFTILVKDQRYKVIFDNMVLTSNALCYYGSSSTTEYREYLFETLQQSFSKKQRERTFAEIEQKMLQLCQDLNQTLNGNDTQRSDDW